MTHDEYKTVKMLRIVGIMAAIAAITWELGAVSGLLFIAIYLHTIKDY